MAFLSSTAFEARVTNNEFNGLCNITGKYQVASADADCSAGLLCVRGDLLPCEGFGSTVFNENAFYMASAAGTELATEPIYACNMYEAQMATVKGNEYFIGTETLGLGIPAGRYGTFTQIIFDGVHKYRFGVGNLTNALSDNGYAVLAAGGMISATDSAPSDAGTPYFKVMGSGAFVEGTQNSFGYVDLEAHVA